MKIVITSLNLKLALNKFEIFTSKLLLQHHTLLCDTTFHFFPESEAKKLANNRIIVGLN